MRLHISSQGTKQKKGKRLRERSKPVVVNLDEFSSKTNENSLNALENNETEDSPPFSFAARNTRGWYGGDFENEYCDIPFRYIWQLGIASV